MNKNDMSQSPQAADPDMALLYLSSLFEKLHHAPECNCAKLDALARQIMGREPKTPLGLALAAYAEKWLRRHLWMRDFDNLSLSDQAARIVLDSAIRIAARRPVAQLQGPSNLAAPVTPSNC
jgi:hypothetical protein